MVASMALQFSALAALSASTSASASGGRSMRWNRPPLNQGTSSTPNRLPSRMVSKSLPSCVRNASGAMRTPTRRSNRRTGSRPTSSAKKQKTHCVRKWLTRSGATPAARKRSAVAAKVRAASSVISRLLRLGRQASGSVQSVRRRCCTSGRVTSSSAKTWRSLGVPVKCVCTSSFKRSLTTSSGGLSSGSAYIINCRSAPSRLLPGALYSQAKWPLSQTSAKPSVRPAALPVLVTPRSKQ